MAVYVDEAALNSACNPKLHNGCMALIGTMIYMSDGTSWTPHREQIPYLSPLPDPSTASLLDVATKYEAIIANLKSYGWMASS